MKQIYLCFLAMVTSIFIFGCSSNLEDTPIIEYATTNSGNSQTSINLDEAINIANKVLKKDITRSLSALPTCNYVVKDSKTRSLSSSDTLAYVLNYPNDEGFAIISSTKNVYPVLAFSDKGSFSFDNEIAKINFIDKIENYIASADQSNSYEVRSDDFDSCVVINPLVKFSLGQTDPWDKYVIQEHPKCPAGCVAVATALIMLHSKSELSYHGTVYDLKSIVKAIGLVQNPDYLETDENPDFQPIYTYDEAVDKVAKILYWIGDDVDMQYSPGLSTAFSSRAYDLLKSLNFEIPSGQRTFNIEEIAQYVNNGHIVYLRGSDPKQGGHAWVVDGCYFCYSDIKNHTGVMNPYIHCDWGWDGLGNGYYSSSVFSVYNFTFNAGTYFAVKRENQPYNIKPPVIVRP